MTLLICVASSRVGARTRPSGRFGLAAVSGFGFGQAGDQREGESEGLAGAGAAPAQYVAALEGIGKGFNLNRECFVNSLERRGMKRVPWVHQGQQK